MALEGVLRNQGEDLFQLPLVVDVFGKDVFVQRVPRRAVDEQDVSFQAVPRQLAEEIPAPLPHGRRAGAFLQLGPGPEDRPLRPGIEALGVEQGALVVVAQQTELALHDLVDHLAGVGPVAHQIAEAVDLADPLSRMSANTASRLSMLLWISLMRARFTLGDFQTPGLTTLRRAGGERRRRVARNITVYCRISGRSSRDAPCGSRTNPPCCAEKAARHANSCPGNHRKDRQRGGPG